MEKLHFPVYVINLKKRADRKQHIIQQFSGRSEFEVKVVEAKEHEVGAIGLWQSILHILTNLVDENEPFIILCEDDHEFKEGYSSSFLASCIAEGEREGADILLGGVSWMNSMIPVSDHLYWIEDFSGLQFTIVFKNFFSKILEAEFGRGDAADFKISSLTTKKYVLFPFISIQKGFDYSDVTQKNNREGRVSELFQKTDERAKMAATVRNYYDLRNWQFEKSDPDTLQSISLPTYIINESGSLQKKEWIESQFYERTEFVYSFVEAPVYPITQIGLWMCIKMIIEKAILNQDDVIIICGDGHQFTEDYTKEYLISNIIEAYQQGTDIISGGAGGFGLAVPITANRHWVSECKYTMFYVIFHKFFEVILNEPFTDEMDVGTVLSEMTANKNLLYPFISVPRQVICHNEEQMESEDQNDLIFSNLYQKCSSKLGKVRNAFLSYQS